ncbi:MAG: hypothetical protein ACLQUY_13810 [Ktedonobacterales bacterium]
MAVSAPKHSLKGPALGQTAISERGILARLMQSGFNPGALPATMVEKASGCPEIYVIVRKFVLEVSGNSCHLPQLGNDANFQTEHMGHRGGIFLTKHADSKKTVRKFMSQKMT